MNKPDALAAANERIRELEADNKNLIDTLRAESTALVAEREVSDKLERALNAVNAKFCSRPYGTGSYIAKPLRDQVQSALAEVAAIRAKQQAG